MKPESALAERPTIDLTTVKSTLIDGDLSKLNDGQLLNYYNAVCESLGLNPLTKPFAFIRLNGKLVLYALKDCTEQLRTLHNVSITEVRSDRLEDVFVVTAKAVGKGGRMDAATGAVAIGNLKGESLANALMKAETKAKRRVTLSICGLGMLDETEVETIPQSVVVTAPKRVELPPGTVQILSTELTQWGGDVVVVDANGVETTHKTTDRQLAELCEQIAQESVPVTLKLQSITKGKNAGKVKLVGVTRWTPPTAAQPPSPDEQRAIDAEIAKQDAVL